MTWSIVAREAETGRFAIAIASRFFAVGSLCPWTRAGVGAVATQARVNPLYGPAILDLMADGLAPEAAIARVQAADEGRVHRQVHAIDARGRNAAVTGRTCVEWCGHALADEVSVAGNMLAGAAVVTSTLAAYHAGAGLPLAERLLAAMDAGEAEGGDKRGRQSAAVVIQGAEPFADLDLRVDDSPAPLTELRRLLAVAEEVYLPFRAAMPTTARPSGILDEAERETVMAALADQLKA